MYKSNKYFSEVDRVFFFRIKYNLKVNVDFDICIVQICYFVNSLNIILIVGIELRYMYIF